MDRVLVVDDNEVVAEVIRRTLVAEGFEVVVAYTGEAGLDLAQTAAPDLILLDLNLPDTDGLDVCRRLRVESSVPIIMVTARADLLDHVVGLEVGADGYVAKPFDLAELVARVRALLRRSTDYAGPPSRGVLTCGPLRIDLDQREVTLDGEPRRLAPKEYDLLCALAENSGRPIPSADLLKRVWGYDEAIRTHTLEVHIVRLRAKLERDPHHPELLLTIPGTGYLLAAPSAGRGRDCPACRPP